MTKLSIMLGALALVSAASAQINANGSISYTQTGSVYNYNVRLNNTGTTTIGTLWYAWIPGQDYLPIPPTSTSSHAGWTLAQTTSAGFGTGLQWKASAGSFLASGASLSGFGFSTTTTPAELAGPTIFGTHPPVGTTFVYELPFAGLQTSGGALQFVINPVPEPTAMVALASGALIVLRRTRKRSQ